VHRVALLLGSLILLGACAGVDFKPSAAESHLVDAMSRRLAIAREVAWIKYLNGLPVRDPQREATVLVTVTNQAAARRIHPAVAQKFFAAQIAASCAQQEHWIHLWKRGAPLPSYAPRGLRSGVREDIDLMNRDLLDALARVRLPRPGLRSAAEHALRREGISPRAAALATAPL
jgi:chorismate mutase